MTAGASVEDKRADDRRIKELRDFQRGAPANKRCFDCNEMMPQYVCVDFNTFVCTACSGIHREFGHRVKSISMSKFTETEVKNMLKYGGNEAAQKIWRAKHDANFRPNGGNDGERTRNFIRMTYIDKKWQYESPRASSRDEQPQRTGSGSSSTKKPAAPATDFFDSPTPASSTPSFDAFSQPSPQENNGGFGAFGDFSSFDKPKKQQNDFDDFGRFDSPKSTSSQSTAGFGDFGGFSAKPAAAPPLRDEFKTGSFTLKPPPGSDFGAFAAPSTPSAFAAPPAPAKTASGGGGNDFLAFSPVNSNPPPSDLFGFANSPVAASKTNSQKAATPFDAFGSPGGASAGRSSFDAFGGGAPSPSGFNAFGVTSQAAAPASPGFGAFNAVPATAAAPSFDAFGSASPAAKTSSSSSFDAFGSSSSGHAASAGFDAFGSASSPASAFGGFSSASSSSRTNSGAFGSPARTPAAVPADPFSPFSARTGSGSKAPEPPKASSADPFAAFDEVEAAPALSMTPAAPTSTGSAYDAFGGMPSSSAPPSGQSHGSFGNAPQPFGQAQPYAQTPSHFGSNAGGQPAPPADPFAFPGSAHTAKTSSFSNTSMGAPAKTGSFSSGAAAPQPGFGGPAAFGSFGQAPQQPTPGAFGQSTQPGHGFPPQQQQQQQFQQQQFQQHQQQQMYQQQGQFGQYPAQGYGGQPGMPPQQPQQQQWGQSPNAGAFGSGQFPPHQGQPQQMAQPQAPAPVPAAAPKADAASLKDPFASLNLGSFGVSSAPSSSTSNPSSRGNSFGKPTTASPSVSATSSFSNTAPVSAGGQSHFGAVGGMGFGMGAPAPSSTGGSRGSSFETNKPSFPPTNSSTPSPMASFSMPSAPSSAFGATSPSPMGSFAFPAQNTTPQKQSSFGDANAFGNFGAPPRTDSLKQSAPPAAASSNPFDMF